MRDNTGKCFIYENSRGQTSSNFLTPFLKKFQNACEELGRSKGKNRIVLLTGRGMRPPDVSV